MSNTADFVLHIAFDNTRRLARNVCYFRYKDYLFKLIQNNPKKHSDVLLTIIPNGNKEKEKKAYSLASEFLSTLSWEIGSQVTMRYGGGYGINPGISLRSVQCGICDLPVLPSYRSPLKGYTINKIVKIYGEVQKTALALYRDAYASNHIYLSFLLYWQVLETNGSRGSDIANYLFHTYRDYLHIDKYLDELNQSLKDLGNYLWEDCRCAIAHLQRNNDRTSIRPDNLEDNKRIYISTKIVQKLARCYIKNELNIAESLFLVKCKGTTYQTYVDEEYIRSNACRIVYT